MRKTIYFFFWILFPFSLFSQKLYTNYQLSLSNGDTVKVQYDLLSRKKIYKLLSEVSEINNLKDISSIEDGENRIFRIIKFKNDTLIVEQLVNGYYTLYAGVENVYYLTNDTTTYLLEKTEKEYDDYIIVSNKYRRVLTYLTDNSLDYKDRIDNLKFDEESIKTLIYDINKHIQPDNNITINKKLSKKFSYISLNTCRLKFKSSEDSIYSKTYFGADFYRLHYYPSLSNNLSFRFGLSTTYVRIKYESEIENDNLFYIGIPLCIHAEKTNNLISPYFYLGAFPSFFYENNSLDFGVGILTGFGLKAKISKNINVRTGLKYDMTGLYYDIALEFIK